MKTIRTEIGIQRHELTTGQCLQLEARMLQFGASAAYVTDSILHITIETGAGKNRWREIEDTYRRKTHEICGQLKREKALQRSWGHHNRRH